MIATGMNGKAHERKVPNEHTTRIVNQLNVRGILLQRSHVEDFRKRTFEMSSGISRRRQSIKIAKSTILGYY